MKPPSLNRDHVRAALSVFRVAEHCDDFDEVGAMAAAIDVYLGLEERDAEDERAMARRGLWRSTPEARARLRAPR